MSDEDYGYAIACEVLERGTQVLSADGVAIGKVRSVSNAPEAQIFDGITIDTAAGRRFLDAPEVDRIYERAVITTFVAADADQYLQPAR